LYENNATISRFDLAQGKSKLSLSADVDYRDNNSLKGKGTLELWSDTLGLSKWLNLAITAPTTVTGHLDSPILSGAISVKKRGDNYIKIPPDIGRLKITGLTGKYRLQIKETGIELTTLFSATGKDSVISSARNIYISQDKISGSILYKMRALNFGDSVLNGLSGILHFGGSTSVPEINASGKIKSINLASMSLPSVEYSVNNSKGLINFDVKHLSENTGALRINGELRDDPKTGQYILNRSALSLQNFSIGVLEQHGGKGWVTVSGSGSLFGPFDLTKLRGSLELNVLLETLDLKTSLNGAASIKNGVFQAKLNNETSSLNASIKINLKNKDVGTILSFKNFSTKSYSEKVCITADGSLSYRYNLLNPETGKGKLSLRSLSLGCEPYTISLKKPLMADLVKGRIALKNIVLGSNETSFSLNGTISRKSGFNISADGTLYLNSLLGFTPFLDDMHGIGTVKLSITGPLHKPLLNGSATITDGEFSLESADISARDINGTISLDGSMLSADKIIGEINSGNFTLSGSASLSNVGRSLMEISVKDAEFSPLENSSFTVSADLKMEKKPAKKPLLTGTVYVDSGEIEKNMNLRSILGAISRYLFNERKEASLLSPDNIPLLDLDISLQSRGNLYFFTNWAEIELSANLKLGGSTKEPLIKGEMKTVRGAFGLKERKFDITSGKITFLPGRKEPVIDLLAETQVPSYEGENILIILEAKGPLTSPEVKFSSDYALSEKEIIKLITTSGFEITSSLLEDLAIPVIEEKEYLRGAAPLRKLGSLFKKITSIDSLRIQPEFNESTGTIEPHIVAEKNLAERMRLVGSNSLSSTSSDYSLALKYLLFPFFTISGSVESFPQEQESTYSFDAVYTILSKAKPFVHITIRGTSAKRAKALQEALKLGADSRVSPQDIPMLAKKGEEFYKDLGFLDAEVIISCPQAKKYCKRLIITVDEHGRYKIGKIIFEGDSISGIIKNPNSLLPRIGAYATKEALVWTKWNLLKALRNEGYISARVNTEYVTSYGSRDATLFISVSAGSPVSFIFIGNKLFSPENFLNTINIFTRKQPFGSNTINILVENIEREYRKAGYLNALVSYSQSQDAATGRITYTVYINEGRKIKVRNVRLAGNRLISTKRLLKLIRRKGKALYREFRYPKY
ncbi:MAG: hypothetical protein D6808_07965, partial [Candidatus Dadabacteria bacterium]